VSEPIVDPRGLLRGLDAHQVKYIVFGAVAMTFTSRLDEKHDAGYHGGGSEQPPEPRANPGTGPGIEVKVTLEEPRGTSPSPKVSS
jgi:hypothetical protein